MKTGRYSNQYSTICAKLALMLAVGGHSALDMYSTHDFTEAWEDEFNIVTAKSEENHR